MGQLSSRNDISAIRLSAKETDVLIQAAYFGGQNQFCKSFSSSQRRIASRLVSLGMLTTNENSFFITNAGRERSTQV